MPGQGTDHQGLPGTDIPDRISISAFCHSRVQEPMGGIIAPPIGPIWSLFRGRKPRKSVNREAIRVFPETMGPYFHDFVPRAPPGTPNRSPKRGDLNASPPREYLLSQKGEVVLHTGRTSPGTGILRVHGAVTALAPADVFPAGISSSPSGPVSSIPVSVTWKYRQIPFLE